MPSAISIPIRMFATVALLAGCAQSLSGSPAAEPSQSVAAPHASPSPATDDVVAWVDSTAPPYVLPTQGPLPTDAPPCVASDLATKVDPLGAGLGNTNLPVQFINQSSRPCLLAGYPTLSGVTRTGNVIVLHPGHGSYFGDPGPTTNIGPGGSAALNISGGDNCPDAMLTKPLYPTLRIGLPEGGTIAVPSNGFDTICGVSVSQFGVPAAEVPEPNPVPSPLVATIDGPTTAAQGSLLSFTVTLANPTADDVIFPTCPAYVEFVGSGDSDGWVATVDNYYLNCGSEPIPAGGHRTFAMRLQLPANQPLGFAKFGWDIQGDSGPFANAALTIVAP